MAKVSHRVGMIVLGGVVASVVAVGSVGCGPPDIIEAASDGTTETGDGDGDGDGSSSGETGGETGGESGETEGEACGDGELGAGEVCDDGNVDDTDGCLSTCVPAEICSQILAQVPGASDGVYTIDPDGDGGQGPFEAYCDMSSDGGGWTLVAKVHRFHDGPAYPEPRGWFAEEIDAGALLDTVAYEDRAPGLASHGRARFVAAVPDVSVARFVVIAEDDPGMVATWFKAVDDDAFAWFSGQDHAPTAVCEDPELTLGCDDGRLRSGDWTPFEGMNLADYGYPAGCVVHMRLEGDDSHDAYTALCSCTQDNDGNEWSDDAIDGHWGNGLEIWFR